MNTSNASRCGHCRVMLISSKHFDIINLCSYHKLHAGDIVHNYSPPHNNLWRVELRRSLIAQVIAKKTDIQQDRHSEILICCSTRVVRINSSKPFHIINLCFYLSKPGPRDVNCLPAHKFVESAQGCADHLQHGPP